MKTSTTSPRQSNKLNRPFIKVALALTAACLLQPAPASAVDTLPILWEAGGASSGTDSAGQAARVAVDSAGNLAVVSGPSNGRNLAVTSYTATGSFRWTN